MHPALFGIAYAAIDRSLGLLQLSPPVRSTVLLALPKIIQSVFAATSDFYTWKLSEKLYGANSTPAWAAVCIPYSLAPHSALSAEQDLVLDERLQPLAVVLLHQDLLQFDRDYLDSCRPPLLAVGASWRRKGEQGRSPTAGQQCEQVSIKSRL